MIFLPTRARLKNINRFIEAYTKTEATEFVVLLVDKDDFTYNDLDLNSNFAINYFDKSNIASLMNEVFKRYPNEDVYGIMADDVLPETPKWDKILREQAVTHPISWGNDGLHGINLPTHPFLNGDIVRKLGFIAPPELKHCYVDNFWLLLAHTIGGAYCPNVKLTHYHPIVNLAESDDTYKNQPDMNIDASSWEEIRPKYQTLLKEMI